MIYTGAPIALPGIYANVPMDTYHGQLTVGHSASHSSLERLWSKSPLHFFDRWYANPDRADDAPSEYMVIGKAAHALFLGEPHFAKQFIRRPEIAPDGRQWHGSNKSCIEWMARAAASGRTVLSPSQVEQISGMAKRLDAEPLVRGGMLSGLIEQSFVWQDAETGLWLKARPDVVPADGDYVDLKIVSDISDDGIQRSITSFGYHRQAALVLEGASRLLGVPFNLRGGKGETGLSFTLVFVESSRPHAVEIVTLKPSDIEAGRAEVHAALRLLKHCIDKNWWPGPSGEQRDARFLGLSGRSIERNEYRLGQIKALMGEH